MKWVVIKKSINVRVHGRFGTAGQRIRYWRKCYNNDLFDPKSLHEHQIEQSIYKHAIKYSRRRMKPQSWMIVFLPVVKEMHAISCNVLQHVQGAVLFVCSLKKIWRINSLWSRDAIWRHRSRSTLVQIIACCLTAPCHYLKLCWIIFEVFWYLAEGNFTESFLNITSLGT